MGRKGPWRFAYDETGERAQVHRVMKMLEDEPQKRKRVYVLIGNEPFEESMQRIKEVMQPGQYQRFVFSRNNSQNAGCISRLPLSH